MKKLLLLFLFSSHICRAAMMANAVDWEAQRWAKVNIPAQGGTISSSSYLTGDLYMRESKWWGIRPLLGRILLSLGDQTNAFLSPIIYDWSASSVTNDDLIAFVSTDWTETNGLKGNTTTKYLRSCKNTGLGLGSFTSINNVHSAVYIRDGTNESSYACGYASAGNCTFGMPISFAGNSWIEINLTGDSVADSSGVGFYLSTRIIESGTTNRTTYKNTTNIVSSSSCNGNLGSGAWVFHAFNSAGSIVSHTSRSICYHGLGYGIPAARVSAYNTMVQTVQKRTFGRNVP